MHRRKYKSDVQSTSSSITQSEGRTLPIVECPDCGILVKKFVSRTNANPDKIFYKCDNYQNMNAKCRFWKWEKDYVAFLDSIGTIGMQSKVRNELLEDEIVGLKREHSQLVTILKNDIGELRNVIGDLKNEIGELKKENYKLNAMLAPINFVFIVIVSVVVFGKLWWM